MKIKINYVGTNSAGQYRVFSKILKSKKELEEFLSLEGLIVDRRKYFSGKLNKKEINE